MGPARLQSAQRPEYDRRRNALRAAPGRRTGGPRRERAARAVRAPASRSRDKRSARRNGRRRVRACRRSHEPLAIAARARKQPMAGGRGNVGAPPCRGPPKCRRRMRRIEGAPIATHCSPLRSSRPLRPIAPIAVARAPESAKPRRRPDRAAHMLRRHTASPPLRLTTSLPIPSSPRPLTALRPQPTPIVRRNADPDQKVSAADFF